jgi:hypothetical protein
MRVVEVEIITGKGAGNMAFILRIKFIFDNNSLPFTFARKQFPLRLAYAMTIKKSDAPPSSLCDPRRVQRVGFAEMVRN